jgi:hypothetical protein
MNSYEARRRMVVMVSHSWSRREDMKILNLHWYSTCDISRCRSQSTENATYISLLCHIPSPTQAFLTLRPSRHSLLDTKTIVRPIIGARLPRITRRRNSKDLVIRTLGELDMPPITRLSSPPTVQENTSVLALPSR